MRPSLRLLLAMCTAVALPGCGGSSGSSGSSSGSTDWTPGVYPPSSSFAARCAAPRTGTDPTTGRPYPDVAGSTAAENNFLRSWTNELYLWYSEVPDRDPNAYASTADYFDLLKTTATTASGNPKDKFHFTYPTDQWVALAQSGVQAGYGVQWAVVASRPPRLVVVAYTEPGSPATTPPADLARGAQVLTVDGVDLVNATDTASVATLNEGLFPTSLGTTHTFSILDLGASSPRTITMTSANVASTPVQNVGTVRGPSGTVGYMLFNDHLATSEGLLMSAFAQLAAAHVNDLVLDIRYNGGGYLDVASEVAYMIAGPGPTAGQTFERTIFNDKNPNRDPVTGQALTPVPFHSTSQGFSGGAAGQALPTLDLSRVAVVTTANTCSASESIMNSLRGVGVEVVQIGTTTCGKPYGFYPQDNCGTTYFSIEFEGVNAQGFGDYPDGFSPANTASSPGVTVPGCSVGDDLTHALGDPAEANLAAALGYLGGEACPAAAAVAPPPGVSAAAAAVGVVTPKSPWRENRILRRPRP
jgi:carboxyl-terminal processing protease